MIEIKVLDRNNWGPYSEGIQELEAVTEYPYGADFFRLNHGPSYFRFFERLGEPIFHIAIENGKILACGAGVLRKIPASDSWLPAWYLCDLKVHPDYRGKQLASKLFRKKLLQHYFRCGRGYGISMNPSRGPNRVVKLVQKMSWLNFGLLGELHFYNLTWQQMTDLQKTISQFVGPVSFLSLEGKKDLIMKSTQRPMKLIHVQHGPLAEPQFNEPQKEAVHMICASTDSQLNHFLKSQLPVSATASIVGHRMPGVDWNFILTSDI